METIWIAPAAHECEQNVWVAIVGDRKTHVIRIFSSKPPESVLEQTRKDFPGEVKHTTVIHTAIDYFDPREIENALG